MSQLPPEDRVTRRYLAAVWQDDGQVYSHVLICPSEERARQAREGLLAEGHATVHVLRQTIEILEV